MLTHADSFPAVGVEDTDGITFEGPLHVVAFSVAGVGFIQGKHATFPQGKPFYGAALASRGLPGELRLRTICG